MGIFSRGKNKIYSLSDAMKMLKTERFANYTAIPVNEENTMYRLIPEENALKQAREVRKMENRYANQKEQFSSRITGNGSYKDIGLPNYNDYQSKSKNQEMDFCK